MNRLHRAVASVLVVCPIILVFWTCARGPSIPQNDYWFYFNNIVDEKGFSSSTDGWLARHNNHLLTGAYVVYAANLKLTNGSNRGLAVFSWGCAVGILALLRLWTWRVAGHSEAVATSLLIASSWFVFSPLLAMFWFMGFSGVHTMGSVVLCLIAIHLWDRYRRTKHRVSLVASLATVVIALTFFSSTLPLLPVLAVAAIFELRRDPRCLVPFLFLLVIASLVWFVGYQAQPSRPFTVTDLASQIAFSFAFIGSALTRAIEPAIGAGMIAAAAAVVLLVRRWRQPGEDQPGHDTCWWMLLGFGVGNAALTALARSSTGLETAFASRYAVFPVLIWIALGALLLDAVHRTTLRRITVIVVCAIAVASQLNGRSYFLALERRAQLEPALLEAVQMGIMDLQGVNGVVTPWAGAFLRALPALSAHGYVPFVRHEIPAQGSEPQTVAGQQPPETTIWAQRVIENSVHRVAGEFEVSLALGTALVLVDGDGDFVGRAATVPGPHEGGGQRSHHWIGYLRVPSPVKLFVSTPSGKLVGSFCCCDPGNPLAGDVNPFMSPYPRWFNGGTYRSQWLQRTLGPR